MPTVQGRCVLLHNRIEKPDHTVGDSYRNDDGTGTLERYKKDSFYWCQNVIKTNGACLNEQVKKITRHFVLRKEKIVHEKS